MAANTAQVTQDIKRLSTAMDQLSRSSSGLHERFLVFSDIMKQLSGTTLRDASGQFTKVRGSVDEFARVLTTAGQASKLTTKQLEEMLRITERLAKANALRFPKGGGQRGKVSTLGAEENVSEMIGTSAFMKDLPGGERALATVTTRLKAMKFQLKDVSDVSEDASRGTVRWTAAMQTTGGVTRRATVVTNKWGQELKSTSRHLRTFAGGIARDIVEVTKWAIAIAIVYAPMRKLTELMQQAVEIEAKLADVQVALQQSTEGLNVVWEESSTIARELGVSVEGVIDGYVLSARATANIIDPAERAAANVALLRDSMILAKLAGLDQAIAMDTLVGALRQLNLPLTEGGDLIDKWVAVSRAANVSLHTLAESFAITATAAENVGITMDELNGFIAAIAEVTSLSATESGNAIRAFISGFQTDQAVRELSKFGIAVRSINGELRAYTAVIEDVIERKDLGLISDKEIGKISEVIGGGARRGAQVNAFLKNYGRVQELAAISAEASGEAAEALAIKMDTLQTATQNLNTAFTELAKTFGDDGGFLDIASGGIKTLTWLVDGFSEIVDILGKATPAVIALSAALILLKRNARVGSFMDQTIFEALGSGRVAQGLAGGMGGMQSVRGVVGGVLGKGGGAMGGALMGGMMALPEMLSDDPQWDKVAASVGGGIVGFMVGGPVGSIIGSAIGQAFVGQLEADANKMKATMAKVAAGAFERPGTKGDFLDLDVDQLNAQIAEVMETALGIGTGAGKGMVSVFGEMTMKNVAGSYRQAIEEMVGATEGTIPEGDLIRIMQEEILKILAGEGRTLGGPKSDLPWDDMLGNIEDIDDPKIRELARNLLASLRENIEGEAVSFDTAFGLRLLGVSERLGPQAATIIEAQRTELLQQVSKGESGVRALTDFLNIGNFEQVVSTVFTAISALGDAGIEYADVANVLINASEQEREIFTQLAGEIAILENEYNDLGDSVEDYAIRQAKATKFSELAAKQAQLDQMVLATQAGQKYAAYQKPDLVGVAGGVTSGQIEQAVATTRKLQEERVKAMTPDSSEQDKIRSGWEDVIFQVGDIFNTEWSGIFEDLDTGILAEVIKEMGIEAQAAAQLPIITPDITSSQKGQFYGNIRFFENLIEQLRPLDRETQGAIYKDYITDTIHADGLAVQLAMATLIDVSEQQLEGIFNIPEGVTAAIPFTGKLYFSDQPIPTAGGGGMEALGPPVDQLVDEAIKQTGIEGGMAGSLIGIEAGIQSLQRMDEQLEAEPAQAVATQVTEAIAEAMRAQAALFSENPELKEHRRFLEDQVREETVNPELRLHQRFLESQEGGADATFSKDFTESLDYFSESVGAAVQQPFQQLFDMFSNLFGLGTDTEGVGGGISSEQVLAALPQSIPVNIQTRITNPVTVLVDGFQIASAIYERNYEDLQSATRRQGAVGYIMEA